MTSMICILARVDGKLVELVIKPRHLDWMAFDAGETVERDSLPEEIYQITISSKKGFYDLRSGLGERLS